MHQKALKIENVLRELNGEEQDAAFIENKWPKFLKERISVYAAYEDAAIAETATKIIANYLDEDKNGLEYMANEAVDKLCQDISKLAEMVRNM